MTAERRVAVRRLVLALSLCVGWSCAGSAAEGERQVLGAVLGCGVLAWWLPVLVLASLGIGLFGLLGSVALLHRTVRHGGWRAKAGCVSLALMLCYCAAFGIKWRWWGAWLEFSIARPYLDSVVGALRNATDPSARIMDDITYYADPRVRSENGADGARILLIRLESLGQRGFGSAWLYRSSGLPPVEREAGCKVVEWKRMSEEWFAILGRM